LAIKIVRVEDRLRDRAVPLHLVELEALSTRRETYRTLVWQAQGPIVANLDRVGHANQEEAALRCTRFLEKAVATYSDLVVAPEYSVPWSVIDQIAAGALRPPQGALWVLGAESISPSELQASASRYEAAFGVAVLYESLDPRQVAQKRYLDTLVYVFWATDAQNVAKLCILAQFKTAPCRDYHDFEQRALCLGNDVYSFNPDLNKIGLLTIICSDAFDFTPFVDGLHKNCLLIHIQLNPKPAHVDYAAYRTRLVSVGSNSDCELLCLNWAENVIEIAADGREAKWKNPSASAWYVPPSKYSVDADALDELHKNGMYYTLLSKRWHAFFLNFSEQMLLIKKQKMLVRREQALLPRNCLEVEGRWRWDGASSTWLDDLAAADGFGTVLAPYINVAASLGRTCSSSPFSVERALEALVGPSGPNPTNWYELANLLSVQLDPDEESIRRVTVHQETKASRPGVVLRKHRLQRANDAVALPGQGVPWVPSVSDLEQGFSFAWHHTKPHHNVMPTDQARGAATLVYLSDEADDSVVESIRLRFSQGLSTHASAAATDAKLEVDQMLDAINRSLDRLCIVFRRDGRYEVCGARGVNRIDRSATESHTDIAGDAS
jgi:hypothetical protein